MESAMMITASLSENSMRIYKTIIARTNLFEISQGRGLASLQNFKYERKSLVFGASFKIEVALVRLNNELSAKFFMHDLSLIGTALIWIVHGMNKIEFLA